MTKAFVRRPDQQGETAMSPKAIHLPEQTILNVKADLIKGYVDVTLRSRLTLDFMKLRPQILDLAANGILTDVEITPPPNLFDQIELGNPQTGQSATLGAEHGSAAGPLDP
jgi:hypothetical protein